MTLTSIQKITFAGAIMAVFTFTACAEKQQEGASTAQEQHEGMNHEAMNQESMAGKTVVDAPDYTAVAEPIKTQVSALLDAYLNLKEALVASDAEAAKTAANKVLAVANAIPVATLEGGQKQFAEEKTAQVKESAGKIATAADVEAQRANLEPLSEATFALTKAFDATSQKLYYQRCPMANNNEGGYWLSSTEEIRNPYLGENMMTCGSNEEVLN